MIPASAMQLDEVDSAGDLIEKSNSEFKGIHLFCNRYRW